MEQADGGRFHTEGQEFFNRPFSFLMSERDKGLAVAIHSFVDLEAPAARDKWFRQLKKDVVYVIAHLAAYLQGIAKATTSQKAGFGSVSFDNHISHQGGAVDGLAHLLGIDFFSLQHLAHDIDDRLGRVITGSQSLANRKTAGVWIEDNDIRERTAYIDANFIFARQCNLLCPLNTLFHLPGRIWIWQQPSFPGLQVSIET